VVPRLSSAKPPAPASSAPHVRQPMLALMSPPAELRPAQELEQVQQPELVRQMESRQAEAAATVAPLRALTSAQHPLAPAALA